MKIAIIHGSEKKVALIVLLKNLPAIYVLNLKKYLNSFYRVI